MSNTVQEWDLRLSDTETIYQIICTWDGENLKPKDELPEELKDEFVVFFAAHSEDPPPIEFVIPERYLFNRITGCFDFYSKEEFEEYKKITQ